MLPAPVPSTGSPQAAKSVSGRVLGLGRFSNAAAQSFLVRDRNVIHWAPKRHEFVSLELTHGMRAPSEPSRSQDADSTLAAVAELILALEVGLGGAFCSGVAHLIIIIKDLRGASAAQCQSCPRPERGGSSPAARQCSQAGSTACQCSAGPACELLHTAFILAER